MKPLHLSACKLATPFHFRKSEVASPLIFSPSTPNNNKHTRLIFPNPLHDFFKPSHVTNHQTLQSPSFTCSNKTSNLSEPPFQFSESSTTLTTLPSNQSKFHQLEHMHVNSSQTHFCYTQPETHYKCTLVLLHQVIKPTLNHRAK
jgi:hypothetical protein